MVTCAEQTVAANESQRVTDPVLVIEVLSPGTEAIDRRENLHAYRRLPALKEYALISPRRAEKRSAFRRMRHGSSRTPLTSG